ncbi:hypothetical protein QSV08_09865 [Maribacter sp. BPC-D8]|uniref:hypothetical protein n=1 Tax=Maribacter sp. BPC-D8 TaxID=3053613 RepID=UPI002B469E1E|nr:hypothetical protein [Maribacter sp. BPC-D8]WRI31542.1 hypothetical protein QSV08_09865 [Maribacter sp. BPC-D8]
MKSPSEKLIEDFKQHSWQVPNLYQRLFELFDEPNEIFSFCKQFLIEFEDSTTLFNDALSYVTKENFKDLILLAINTLKQSKNDNDNAAEVIAYASLQFPDLLHQHLDVLFKLKPNESSYYSEYPWRDLPFEKALILKDKFIAAKTKKHEKEKLFSCLLETRNLKIIEEVYSYTKENNFFQYINDEDLNGYLIACLENVGYTIKENKITRYCSKKVRHINFQTNYFLNKKPIHFKKHPTWYLNSENNSYNFGGAITNDENNPLTHIITLSTILKELGISDLTELTLGLHINEINEGYGNVYYKHNNLGKPQLIGDLHNIEDCIDLPIKPTTIKLAVTPERWKYQFWGSANSRENLFRIGGEPTWIQSAEVLTCPKCKEKMNFLLQLDTAVPDTNGDELYFGSGGICYAFWCDEDKISGYSMQWT